MVREKSGNFNRLSEGISFIIPKVQSDDLSSFRTALSRSQGNFSEVREKSRNMKFKKSGHPEFLSVNE